MSARTYTLDPTHSHLGFVARHLVVSKVRGQFRKFDTQLELDPANWSASKVSVTIDTASIDTGIVDRDNHLRSADFFDAPNFPAATFKSTRIEGTADALKITGDLTIRGTTKPVTLAAEFLGEAKDPWGNTKAGFSARATLDRREFGLTWNKALETGGMLVSEKIELEIDVQAVAAAAQKAA